MTLEPGHMGKRHEDFPLTEWKWPQTEHRLCPPGGPAARSRGDLIMIGFEAALALGPGHEDRWREAGACSPGPNEGPNCEGRAWSMPASVTLPTDRADLAFYTVRGPGRSGDANGTVARVRIARVHRRWDGGTAVHPQTTPGSLSFSSVATDSTPLHLTALINRSIERSRSRPRCLTPCS